MFKGSDGSNQSIPTTELSANTIFMLVSTTTVGRSSEGHFYPPVSPNPINDASIAHPLYNANVAHDTFGTTKINNKDLLFMIMRKSSI